MALNLTKEFCITSENLKINWYSTYFYTNLFYSYKNTVFKHIIKRFQPNLYEIFNFEEYKIY